MIELLKLRQENSKTFDIGGGKHQWQGSIGAVHYKDNYADKNEAWKDIDLTWEGNRITRAPFELTLEGNKATIKNKRSGEVSTIELVEIGGRAIPPQAWKYSEGLARAGNIEVKVENGHIRFARILKSNASPIEAKFKVKGNFVVRARDAEGNLPVEAMLKDGILTETLKPDRTVKYPVRIDPTWQVGAVNNDGVYHKNGTLFILNNANAGFGYHSATYQGMGAIMRFTSVTIPRGAAITGAYLTLTPSESHSLTTVNVRIKAEDADNPSVFSSQANYDSRSFTAAVDWNNLPSCVDNVPYDSPSIVTPVQTVVNRGSWASGNAMSFQVQDWDERSTQSDGRYREVGLYNHDSATAPELIVTYTVPTPVTDGDLIGIPVIRKS